MAQPGQTQLERRSADGASGTALVFTAGGLYCALTLDEIIETMRPLPLRPLAGTGAIVRGICVMRGTPAPVIDVAQLLGGHTATASRFIAVRTDRGPVAFATGEVLGIRSVGDTVAARRRSTLLGGAPTRLIGGIGTFRGEPLLVLQDMSVLSEAIWAEAGAEPVEAPGATMPVATMPVATMPVTTMPGTTMPVGMATVAPS